MIDQTSLPWMHLVQLNQVFNSAKVNRILSASLLASGDGTEVIHHRLLAGTYWNLEPGGQSNLMESIFILSGSIRCLTREDKIELLPGDCLTVHPVREKTVFRANEDTDFIYVCSQPIFEVYSQSLNETQNLAIEIENKDGYTSNHCSRIMSLSLRLGEALHLSPEQLYQLQFGAFFHDIGKVWIPETILNKPGPLEPAEWDIMKQHTSYGQQILTDKRIPELAAASLMIGQHHERFNGSGYPLGLQGDEIHVGAAIVAVVDSYDAMTSTRSYRQARSSGYALQELRTLRGQLYHPDVVDAFLSLFRK